MQTALVGPCGVFPSGDAATWVGAIGTLLAFGVALFVYHANVQDRLKAQARLVSGYTTGALDEHPAGATLPFQEGEAIRADEGLVGIRSGKAVLVADAVSFGWEVRNDSAEMLGRVCLFLVDDTARETRALMSRAYMRSKEVDACTFVVRRQDAPSRWLRPKVVFEDAVGSYWERSPGSPLKRITKRTADAMFAITEAPAGSWEVVDPSNPAVLQFTTLRDQASET